MSALAANSSFTDVPENAWFYKPVTYMSSMDQGLVVPQRVHFFLTGSSAA